MAQDLERLLVRIDATTEQLRRELKTADGAVNNFQRNVEKRVGGINDILSGVGKGLAAAFTVDRFVRFTKGAIEAADAIADLSKRTGVATTTLQRLNYLAVQSGTDIEKVAGGWSKYNVNLAAAVQGGTAAVNKFKQIGLEARDLRKLSPEDQILAIGDAINALGTQSDKTKAAVDLFGRSGAELIPIFEGGAEAMRQMFSQQGRILSDEQIRKIDEFGDRWATVKLQMQAVAAEGFVAILDGLEEFRTQYEIVFDDIDEMSTRGLKRQIAVSEAMIETARKQRAAMADDGKYLLPDIFGLRDQSRTNFDETIKEQTKLLEEAQKRLAKLTNYGQKFGPFLPAKEADESAGGLRRINTELDTLTKHQRALKEQAGDAFAAARNEAEHLGDELTKIREKREQEQRARQDFYRDMRESAERSAEAASLPWIHLGDNLQDAAADALAEWKLSFETIASLAKRTGAEVTSALAFRPFVQNILGKSASGGLYSSTNLVQSGSGILGKISGVTGAIDSFGASALPSIFAPNSLPWLSNGGMLGGMGIGLSSIALPVAGLALGALAGKVFSGPRPHPASTFGGTGFTSSGGVADIKLLSKHIGDEFASGLADGLKQAAAQLQAAGLNLGNFQTLQGGVNDGSGFLSFGDSSKRLASDTVTFNPDDAEAGLAKFIKLVAQNAANAGDVFKGDLLPALKAIQTEGRTTAEVLGDVVALAMRDTLQKQFKDELTLALLDSVSPSVRKFAEENARYQDQLNQAQSLGLGQDTIARINQLHEQNIKLLGGEADKARDLAQRYAGISSSFKTILFDLRYGQYSPLAPGANLAALRSQVTTLGAQARLGDADAAEELAKILPQFVQLSGSFNGFNQAYEQDRQLAESLAQAAQDTADRQLAIQQQLLDQADTQTALLQQIAASLGASGGAGAFDKLWNALKNGDVSTSAYGAIIQASGYTGGFGNKAPAGFFSDPANSLKLATLARAAGIPGFATGGLVTGGLRGMDSVPAMLSPDEFVVRARAARAIGTSALHQMNQTGSVPANDNGAALEIRALRQDVNRLIQAVVASGTMTAAQLQEVVAVQKGAIAVEGRSQWVA